MGRYDSWYILIIEMDENYYFYFIFNFALIFNTPILFLLVLVLFRLTFNAIAKQNAIRAVRGRTRTPAKECENVENDNKKESAIFCVNFEFK